jgi:PhnB protein
LYPLRRQSPALNEGRSTVTGSSVKGIPEGLHTITPHIVVRDAAQAAEWYKQAFGAQERSRVPCPAGG